MLIWLAVGADRSLAAQTVELSWIASPSPAVAAYRVYYGTASGLYLNSMTFGDVSDVIIPGLQAGTTYYFAVAARDSDGNESPLSGEIAFIVPFPVDSGGVSVAEPAMVSAQIVTSPAGVQLSWNAVTNAGIAAYNVYYGTESGQYTDSIVYGPVTNAVIRGLQGGGTYYFAVMAVDAFGHESPLSSEATALVPLPAPMWLKMQTYADGNGTPYVLEVRTDATVSGAWEMDYSSDLVNWHPYTYGYGGGYGNGYDVDVWVWVDPTVAARFFRIVQ